MWPGKIIFELFRPGDREYDKFHLNYRNEKEYDSLESNSRGRLGVGKKHVHYRTVFSRTLNYKESIFLCLDKGLKLRTQMFAYLLRIWKGKMPLILISVVKSKYIFISQLVILLYF